MELPSTKRIFGQTGFLSAGEGEKGLLEEKTEVVAVDAWPESIEVKTILAVLVPYKARKRKVN